MPTHEELARFLRQFNKLSLALRSSFMTAALALAEDLGDRGFDPTPVRPSLRLHKLSGENVWSVSFAGQHRAVFHLGEQQRPGHAHIVWEFIGTHADYEREY
ncbi:MAG TPA: hypothetical protein VMU39_07805 [Solirubrobacteraceae bacterium]|nr:hypothetical protein [Solirubrobacteraceae bacterium]